MPQTDPRVDAYIAKSADFAQPILKHLRSLIHQACPQVQETMKWQFPHFDHKGMMCSMAAFKKHCSFAFWKGELMKDPDKVMTKIGETAMGHFGKITRIADLPDDAILLAYLKEAKKLNDDGIKLPKKTKSNGKKELDVPDYFMQALEQEPEALATFNNFSWSNKKEYVEWITDAKTEATRDKRLATAVEWMAEGKIRNWKYVKK